MKTHNLLLLLFLLAASTHGADSAEADFYVATNGSDEWSGTLASPTIEGSDGPFATLERARDAVRELKKKHSGAIEVLVREGIYQLKKTVVFRVSDSGSADATITYAAYPGENPVFSSGREITNWKLLTDDLSGLPEAAQGKVKVADVSDQFLTLYDKEGLLPRARSTGFIPLKGSGRDRLHFPGEQLKNWSSVTDLEIVVRPHHAWIVNILPVTSMDEKAQIARSSLESTYVMNPLHFLRETECCWFENALEYLDEPGEWALNSQQGKLYLWPRNETPVFAPRLNELIRVEGEIDQEGPQDTPVQYLTFRGLTLKHGERYQLTVDDAGLQHDWDMHDKDNALLRLRGTENCVIENCHFLHSGSGAIRVDLHGQKNRITGNHIEHMGGGGILLCGYGPGTKDTNRNNLIFNNHIHHVGEIYWHSPGIFLWQSGENRVANNLIHHTNYTALIASGCMTEFFQKGGRELTRTIRWHEISVDRRSEKTLDEVRPYLHTHDNLIELNEIHHAMEKLGDGNAIYIRGAGPGNVIRRNYIHHLVSPMHIQSAIRTDGGQMDTLIAENLIYKCTSQGIMLKLNNRCENNIVADIISPPRGNYLALREGPMTGAAVKRNIFYSSGGDTTFIDELAPRRKDKTEDRRGRELAKASDADFDFNIYYCRANPAIAEATLVKQQNDGVDVHSKAVDPLFVDPENGDFRFRPDSPAIQMGIVPIDVSKIGLRSEIGAPSPAPDESDRKRRQSENGK